MTRFCQPRLLQGPKTWSNLVRLVALDPQEGTIADLGEPGLLTLLQSFCPAGVVGDDAALLDVAPGQRLVVTTDVLVDGVHFSDRTTPPHSVGWRATAANLSDLAAMGAEGLGITVGLSLPPDCLVSWVVGLYQGIADCLAAYGMVLVGGDVCRSRQRAIAITALGQVPRDWAIARNTAQLGDAIVVTGSHGGARAGLALLLSEQGARAIAPECATALIRQHQYPQPRLDRVPALRQLQTRIAGMDSSDGLADALLQICRASNLGACIEADCIPLAAELSAWQGPTVALDWALYGGEDFELVLTMVPEAAAALCQSTEGQGGQGSAKLIGRVTAGDRVRLHHRDGSEQILSLEKSFQHFS